MNPSAANFPPRLDSARFARFAGAVSRAPIMFFIGWQELRPQAGEPA